MYANSEAAHDVNWAAPAEPDFVAVKYGVIRVKFPIDVTHCPSEVYAAASSAAVITRVEGLDKLDSSARCLEETSQYYPTCLLCWDLGKGLLQPGSHCTTRLKKHAASDFVQSYFQWFESLPPPRDTFTAFAKLDITRLVVICDTPGDWARVVSA